MDPGLRPRSRSPRCPDTPNRRSPRSNNAVDIVALVGEYLPLHRSGSKFKALCPFHDDHNPSLELNPERQSYKCWSCGAGGDIFDFVKDYERVEFPEALRMLAERAGVALDEPGRRADVPRAVEDRTAGRQRLGRAGLRRGPGRLGRGPGLRRGPRDLAPRASRGSAWASPPSPATGCRRGPGRTGSRSRSWSGPAWSSRPAESPGPVRERFRGRLIFPIHDVPGPADRLRRPDPAGGRASDGRRRARVSRNT